MNCTCGDCLTCDLRNMGRLEEPRPPKSLRIAGLRLQREFARREYGYKLRAKERRAGKLAQKT